MREFDIAVVGGGPAGAVAALTAARAGADVLLVDAGRSSDAKGEILPSYAKPMLRALGILHLFESRHPSLCAVRAAWVSSNHTSADSLFSAHGESWRFDRGRFNKDVVDELIASEVTVRRNTKFVRATPCDGRWTLQLEDEVHSAVVAGAVVDATGRRHSVARGLGARRDLYDRLVAVVCELPATDEEETLLVEAVSCGWWYSVRSRPSTRVFGFMTDIDLLRRLGAARPSVWLSLLEATTVVGRSLCSSRAHRSPPSSRLSGEQLSTESRGGASMGRGRRRRSRIRPTVFPRHYDFDHDGLSSGEKSASGHRRLCGWARGIPELYRLSVQHLFD